MVTMTASLKCCGTQEFELLSTTDLLGRILLFLVIELAYIQFLGWCVCCFLLSWKNRLVSESRVHNVVVG